MVGGADHLDGIAEGDAAFEAVAKVAAKRGQICGIGGISLGHGTLLHVSGQDRGRLAPPVIRLLGLREKGITRRINVAARNEGRK
jgi:hypothetical protein